VIDLITIISGATLLQAAVFAGVLLADPQRQTLSRRLLAGVMIVLVLDKADQLFRLAGLPETYPQWAMIGNTAGILMAPLIYLHIQARIAPDHRLRPASLLMALPFAALLIYVISSYHILPLDQKIALFRDGTIETTANRYVIPALINLSNLGFLLATIYKLNTHHAGVFKWFSNPEGRVFPGVLLALVLMASLIVTHPAWTFLGTLDWRLGLNLGQFFLMNTLALSALRHGAPASAPAVAAPAVAAPRDQKPDIAISRTEIDRVMQKQKPYLDADLSLAALADAMRCRPRDLSEALNQGAGQNFYTYVNTWRIEEAKTRLREDPKTAVLDIALACGFNSKSAFNAAFKRALSTTPTEWRRQRAS